jgi:hypothetical protein
MRVRTSDLSITGPLTSFPPTALTGRERERERKREREREAATGVSLVQNTNINFQDLVFSEDRCDPF